MTTDPRQNLPPQIADAIAKGNLIEAIKYLRASKPNLGLAEAKALIEAIQRQQNASGKVNVNVNVKAAVKPSASAAAATAMHHQSAPHVPHHAPMSPSMDPHVSPGEVPRTSGGAVFAGLVAAIVVVIAAAVYFGS